MNADITKQPEDFLPLTFAVFHILIALVDKERHGYGIILEIAQQTEGHLNMAPGTLYGAISRLLREGLIEESDERPDPELDDKRRRYYKLTELGHAVVTAESHRLEMLVNIARQKAILST